MDFFRSAIDTLATVLTLIGSGLGFWGIVNLLEGYGNDNQSRHVPRSVRE
ncbi:MAG: Maff2 family protein [Clostridiales bacterium]|nr:Maff2 family protein [Clostridiales bacterium]